MFFGIVRFRTGWGISEFHVLMHRLVRYLVASMSHLSLIGGIPDSIWISGVGVDLKHPRMVLSI